MITWGDIYDGWLYLQRLNWDTILWTSMITLAGIVVSIIVVGKQMQLIPRDREVKGSGS